MGHNPHPHHHTKFYILLTTVVVGAILILLLVNEKGELSLTGSSVGIGGDVLSDEEEKAVLEDLSRGGEIEFRLELDRAPEVKEETKLKGARVVFNDLSSKVKINEEELELRGLEKIEMEVEGFEGEVSFDEIIFSLKGKGDKIKINGIEISTKGKMEILFNGLVYEELRLEGVKFNLMVFGKGSGELALGGRIKYELEEEKITINTFRGDLSIGEDNESLVVVEGDLSGISTEGEFGLTIG